MALLIIGLVLFLGIHSVRMTAPSWRAKMIAERGEGPYKGLYSLIALLGLVLIAWGFGAAAQGSAILFVPPFGLRHISYALMILALVLAVASAMPLGWIKRAVRHPLLIGTLLWAIAHLFVNGDLASVILFGAFLVWAIADLVAQRGRASAEEQPQRRPAIVYDIAAIVVGLCVYGLLVWRLHAWLFGVSPMA